MVIQHVKHWFVARANASRWKPIVEWSHSQQAQFHQIKDGSGFVIERRRTPGALRIDWGPSTRAYLQGQELRMRCEFKLNPDLQMMVLDRQLMEKLEVEVFDAYTDTLRTRVDTDTPEEMRWLVMFPKLAHMSSKLVRSHYGVLGVNRDLASAWLEGRLSEGLAQATQDLVPPGRPFVMLCLRGNLYLRTTMPEPDLAQIQAFVKLLELAGQEALRVNQKVGDGSPWPTTASIAWQNSNPESAPPQGK